jgi:hypothetical protein
VFINTTTVLSYLIGMLSKTMSRNKARRERASNDRDGANAMRRQPDAIGRKRFSREKVF